MMENTLFAVLYIAFPTCLTITECYALKNLSLFFASNSYFRLPSPLFAAKLSKCVTRRCEQVIIGKSQACGVIPTD